MPLLLGEPRLNPALAYPELRERPGPPALLDLVAIEHPSVSSTLRGWQCMGAESEAGGAGELPHVQLFNPTGSGQRIIVDSLHVSTATTQAATFTKTTTEADTFVRNWTRVQAGLYQAIGQIRSQSSAAAITGKLLGLYRLIANDIVKLENLGIILDEGDGLVFRGNTVATSISVVFMGREFDASTWGVG